VVRLRHQNRYGVQKSAKSLPGRGCPPKLDARDKRHIVRLIEQDYFISATGLAKGIGLRVPPQSIVRWLKDQGMQHS